MTTPTEQREACQSVLDAARKAVAWVNDPINKETVGLERKSVEKRLRRLVTETAKLTASVDKPMCVGVYGPSQAGKSYLVSVLARQGQKPLMARFGGIDAPVDFIKEINPGGERESTGVVTRFSIHQRPSPDGFPVCLRLLRETDVVKIIGNSFFLDGDQRKLPPLEPDAVRQGLADARSRAADSKPADNPLDVEAVWDIQDYFEKTFEGARNLETLRPFWDEAAELLPRLSIADRGALFSLLWGEIPEMTDLYLHLTRALSQLRFATEAYCPIDALVPRTESIIDVMTLNGLGKDGQPELQIKVGDNPAILLPRPIVTALTAELHINIVDTPWPFFAHTDLLDFPGARSRQKVDLRDFLQKEGGESKKELLLRGKVAFLFERYVAEQELTSMLLCVKPSNQDVADLPEMISNWVGVSHGRTAAERVGKTVVLFLVLTMFDTHFVEKAGEERADPGERFASRLFSSIENFLAKAHDWPTQWTPGQSFDNTYWLRNPNYPADSIIEYGAGGQEIGFRQDKVDYIARLKQGFLAQPSSAEFFRTPEIAFDEALKLNDGGVGHLAANLEPVCRPSLKAEQIAGRVRELSAQLAGLLAPFHVSNDAEKRVAERAGVAREILAKAQHLWSMHRFADLLTTLQVSQHGFSEILYEAHARKPSQKTGSTAASPQGERPTNGAVSRAAPPLPGLPPMPGLPPLPGSPPVQPAAQVPVDEAVQTHASTGAAARRSNLSPMLSAAAVEYWLDYLRSASETGRLEHLFDGDRRLASELVGEYANGARRLDLEERIASAIDRLSGSVNEDIDMTLEKASFACASVINHFVAGLGIDDLPANDRPVAPRLSGSETPVFTRPVAANAAAEIPLSPSNHRYDALADWMYAFYRFVEDNARSVDGMTIDFEQNARLGAILAMVGRTGSQDASWAA